MGDQPWPIGRWLRSGRGRRVSRRGRRVGGRSCRVSGRGRRVSGRRAGLRVEARVSTGGARGGTGGTRSTRLGAGGTRSAGGAGSTRLSTGGTRSTRLGAGGTRSARRTRGTRLSSGGAGSARLGLGHSRLAASGRGVVGRLRATGVHRERQGGDHSKGKPLARDLHVPRFLRVLGEVLVPTRRGGQNIPRWFASRSDVPSSLDKNLPFPLGWAPSRSPEESPLCSRNPGAGPKDVSLQPLRIRGSPRRSCFPCHQPVLERRARRATVGSSRRGVWAASVWSRRAWAQPCSS